MTPPLGQIKRGVRSRGLLLQRDSVEHAHLQKSVVPAGRKARGRFAFFIMGDRGRSLLVVASRWTRDLSSPQLFRAAAAATAVVVIIGGATAAANRDLSLLAKRRREVRGARCCCRGFCACASETMKSWLYV